MSGIAGLFHPAGRLVDEQLIHDMAASMEIRGPEKQHYWLDDKVALAHCLLATTTHAVNEYQPSNLRNTVWITADARIDARSELISKLKTGNQAVTDSTTDDQLILQAYQTWGIDCLAHLIGDFSFIIWDSGQQRLFCATDQFGVAPLYYAQTAHGVCVSNTLNTIRMHPEVSDELDDLAIADYLLFRTNENKSGTTFKNIKHVPAAHYLLIENGHFTVQQYWQLSPREELYRATPSTYVEEFHELLLAAVSDRTQIESIATHLSGGMDSSSVNALSHQLMRERGLPQHQQAFTYGDAGTLPNLESPIASEIAESLDIEHYIVPNAKELTPISTPPNLFFPEPRLLSRTSGAYNLLNHAVKQNKVLLTGFGGDPLLAGTDLTFNDINTVDKSFFVLSQAWHHYQHFGKRPRLGLRKKSARHRSGGNRAIEVPNWFNPTFASQNNLTEHINSIHLDQALNQRSGMSTAALWRRIFCWNDPGFTHIPIKLRHPFFDVRLLEFTQSLPPFPWLQDKSILRRAMRHKLPENVTQRPKTPMPGNPFESVIKTAGAIPAHFYALFNNPKLEPYVNILQLKAKLDSIDRCKKSDYKVIIRSLTLSYWLEGYEQQPNIGLESIKGKQHVYRITE
jgi:asparagine synthase (glutamine-hydrolysing)